MQPLFSSPLSRFQWSLLGLKIRSKSSMKHTTDHCQSSHRPAYTPAAPAHQSVYHYGCCIGTCQGLPLSGGPVQARLSLPHKDLPSTWSLVLPKSCAAPQEWRVLSGGAETFPAR